MVRLLALVAFAVPSISSADVISTMTFDDCCSHPWQNVYTEAGITATTSDWFGSNLGLGAVTVFQGVGSFSRWLDVTSETQSLFDAVSFDVLAGGSHYCATTPRPYCETEDGDPISYIGVDGYIGDALVSSLSIFRPKSDAWETVNMEILGTVDRLRFRINYGEMVDGAGCDLARGCGMFTVDNIKIASVPEPETFALMLAGAVGALATRRVKRYRS